MVVNSWTKVLAWDRKNAERSQKQRQDDWLVLSSGTTTKNEVSLGTKFWDLHYLQQCLVSVCPNHYNTCPLLISFTSFIFHMQVVSDYCAVCRTWPLRLLAQIRESLQPEWSLIFCSLLRSNKAKVPANLVFRKTGQLLLGLLRIYGEAKHGYI